MKRSDKPLCVILGGGGHASVLIESIQESRISIPHAILDADKRNWGKEVMDVPVLGGDDLLEQLKGEGIAYFVVGVGSTRDNRPRKRLYELGCSFGLEPLTVVHPAAICSRWAFVAAGSQLFPGSVVNAGTKIGENVIVNSSAVVEHDCVLGNHVHVATGASLSGMVTARESAHIGAGATVKQGLTIGERAVVGAGALVLHDVPPDTTVAGIPARSINKNSSQG